MTALPVLAQTGTFDVSIDRPEYFSVKVPDGNYLVTVTLGSKKRKAETVVRAESRRLMVENAATRKGQLVDYSFVVNKRSPVYTVATDNGVREERVKLKEREYDYLNWDDSLTLEFNGAAPAVSRIKIEPDTTATTIFLCGNSTVVDQDSEPWASWGRWSHDGLTPPWPSPTMPRAASPHAPSSVATDWRKSSQ